MSEKVKVRFSMDVDSNSKVNIDNNYLKVVIKLIGELQKECNCDCTFDVILHP